MISKPVKPDTTSTSFPGKRWQRRADCRYLLAERHIRSRSRIMIHRYLIYAVMTACGVGFVLGQSRFTELKSPVLNFFDRSPESQVACVVDADLTDTAANDTDTTRKSIPQDDDELIERAKKVLGILKKVSQDRLQQPIVELGQKLFWDKRLSANGEVACASCHLPEDWGADRRRYSIDARGKQTKRNSQTVFNSTLQPGLRWVADRKSAADQAEKSLTGSMGFDTADELLPLLKKFDYAAEFQKAFPDSASPLTPQNYASAIEAYEQTLTTPAPLDQYLDGDHSALSPQQKQGLKLFLEMGCADCHSGPLLGGDGLQTFGVYQDYWEATGSEGRDAGLFESTNQAADRNLFRVSMLRNVAQTAPYFHDGSVAELSQAVQVMAKLQLDQSLNEDQIADLVAFLGSLSGQVPLNYRDPFAKKP